nr:MetaGeneMark_Unknown Function [uncultured bacterium]
MLVVTKLLLERLQADFRAIVEADPIFEGISPRRRVEYIRQFTLAHVWGIAQVWSSEAFESVSYIQPMDPPPCVEPPPDVDSEDTNSYAIGLVFDYDDDNWASLHWSAEP